MTHAADVDEPTLHAITALVGQLQKGKPTHVDAQPATSAPRSSANSSSAYYVYHPNRSGFVLEAPTPSPSPSLCRPSTTLQRRGQHSSPQPQHPVPALHNHPSPSLTTPMQERTKTSRDVLPPKLTAATTSFLAGMQALHRAAKGTGFTEDDVGRAHRPALTPVEVVDAAQCLSAAYLRVGNQHPHPSTSRWSDGAYPREYGSSAVKDHDDVVMHHTTSLARHCNNVAHPITPSRIATPEVTPIPGREVVSGTSRSGISSMSSTTSMPPICAAPQKPLRRGSHSHQVHPWRRLADITTEEFNIFIDVEEVDVSPSQREASAPEPPRRHMRRTSTHNRSDDSPVLQRVASPCAVAPAHFD